MSDTNPSPQNDPQEDPKWLDELQDLANRVLGADENGSACEQVHPIIAEWYDKTLEQDPPQSRPAVWQAMSCLATEILIDAEADEVLAPLLDAVDEDHLAMWIETILLIGRSMEQSLNNGDLDDI